MRNLGLIGGLGPGATIHYYRELAKANAGEMLIVHADMPYVLEQARLGDRDTLARYFARLIERMSRGGAEIAAPVPRHTAYLHPGVGGDLAAAAGEHRRRDCQGSSRARLQARG